MTDLNTLITRIPLSDYFSTAGDQKKADDIAMHAAAAQTGADHERYMLAMTMYDAIIDPTTREVRPEIPPDVAQPSLGQVYDIIKTCDIKTCPQAMIARSLLHAYGHSTQQWLFNARIWMNLARKKLDDHVLNELSAFIMPRLRAEWGEHQWKTEEIKIHSAHGMKHCFNVQIASSYEESIWGLSFREFLGADEGMLFVYDASKELSFWMKDTYIPLDIIFIRKDGVITNIVKDAEPHNTTTPYKSQGPVQMALEVPGGTTERLGIQSGDRVIGTSFDPAPVVKAASPFTL